MGLAEVEEVVEEEVVVEVEVDSVVVTINITQLIFFSSRTRWRQRSWR